jgi:hypothetical protein
MTGEVRTEKDASNSQWCVTIVRPCGHMVQSPRRLSSQREAERHGLELLAHGCLSCRVAGVA